MSHLSESHTAYLFEDREEFILLFSCIMQKLGWSIGGIARNIDESFALIEQLQLIHTRSVAFIDGNLDGWNGGSDGKQISEILKSYSPQTVRIGICGGYSYIGRSNGVEGVDLNINKGHLGDLLNEESELREYIKISLGR